MYDPKLAVLSECRGADVVVLGHWPSQTHLLVVHGAHLQVCLVLIGSLSGLAALLLLAVKCHLRYL